MTTTNLLKFAVRTNGRSPQEIYKLTEIVYGSLSVRKPLGGSASMVQPSGEEAPEEVNVFVTVLADDDDELVAAAAAVLNAFRNFEVETVGGPELRSSRPVLPTVVRTEGVSYDEPSQALVIDTWGPTWKDVELAIFHAEDGQVMAIIADYESDRRQEQAVKVKTITVRRPEGTPPTAQPPGLGAVK